MKTLLLVWLWPLSEFLMCALWEKSLSMYQNRKFFWKQAWIIYLIYYSGTALIGNGLRLASDSWKEGQKLETYIEKVIELSK